MNTNDTDWLDDVRRWYFNGGNAKPTSATDALAPTVSADAADVGYEAAHPSLETTDWSRPAATAFGRFG